MEKSSTATDVYHDIAARIVQVLTDNDSDNNTQISKELALKVLKPLLEKSINIGKRIKNLIPDKWFSSEGGYNESKEMANELEQYFKLVQFVAPKNFISDLERKAGEFKAVKREEEAKKY